MKEERKMLSASNSSAALIQQLPEAIRQQLPATVSKAGSWARGRISMVEGFIRQISHDIRDISGGTESGGAFWSYEGGDSAAHTKRSTNADK
jgi:hypothetical protein